MIIIIIWVDPALQFQNNGHMFTSCSEDKSCRLFDIRSDIEVASFWEPAKQAAFTCVANSKSGKDTYTHIFGMSNYLSIKTYIHHSSKISYRRIYKTVN